MVVSAGTLGSTELLMRCRDLYKTLPRLGNRLGSRFSGNGDFLSFVMEGNEPADPNYGPVITQRIDFNLFKDFNKDHAFIMEDASYPVFTSWFVEGVRPPLSKLGAVWGFAKEAWRRFKAKDSTGSVGWALGDLLSGDVSYDTSVLLCIGRGLDRADLEQRAATLVG